VTEVRTLPLDGVVDTTPSRRLALEPMIIRRPLARIPVLTAAAALLVLLNLVGQRYGYHRDELYFRMLPAAWGYTDQPLLTPLLARATLLLADEPWALRLPAAGLAAISVVVVALLTRELGGGRLAQGLAAWGYAFGTVTLNFGHILMTASVDLVVWPMIVLFVVRAVVRQQDRWWWLAGLAVGLSTYNKWLVVLLVVAVVGGLLLAGPRRVMLSRAFLGSAALAVLVAVPNLLWQALHGWPQLAMGEALSANNADNVRLLAGPTLLVMIGPVLLAVCVAGFAALLRRPEWRPLRWLAPATVIVVVLTMVAGAQVHYPYGLVSVIFAAGCVPAAAYARSSRSRLRLLAAGLVLHSALNVLISLPVLPERVLAASFLPGLNSVLAEQIGWDDYVRQIDRVTAGARADDPGVVVLTSNYGEAGALDRYSTHRDVLVVSGHNALGYLGGPPPDTRTVVVVGAQVSRVASEFTACRVVDRLDSGVAVDNEEEGQPIAVCTGPEQDWATLWPVLRHLA
jgi:4-amino-4-deoxy-L-arabinose transferase-like glycosyltransferase